MLPFSLSHLDHVAIRVKDLNISADWYQQVLGLTVIHFEEWGPFPLLLMSGQTGVALFPADEQDPLLPPSRNVKIDHFAFYVSGENFALAQAHFSQSGIPYQFQDHQVYHSLYLTDPDGHTVELTTLVTATE